MYAMKIIDRKRVKLKKSIGLCQNEREILAKLNCPFIVNLKYAFQNPTSIFLIMDLMIGGDLGFWLRRRVSETPQRSIFAPGLLCFSLFLACRLHLSPRSFLVRSFVTPYEP